MNVQELDLKLEMAQYQRDELNIYIDELTRKVKLAKYHQDIVDNLFHKKSFREDFGHTEQGGN